MAAQFSPSENPGENIVTVAQSQLGYAESTRNYSVDENGLVSGYTRYGAWLLGSALILTAGILLAVRRKQLQ